MTLDLNIFNAAAFFAKTPGSEHGPSAPSLSDSQTLTEDSGRYLRTVSPGARVPEKLSATRYRPAEQVPQFDSKFPGPQLAVNP